MELKALPITKSEFMAIIRVRLTLASIALVTTTFAAVPDASAQGFLRTRKEELPKVQYFMARQQWQMVDDSPAINDQRTGFQSQQSGNAPGALGNRPRALPKAGFQGYAPMPTMQDGGLPQVNNGVPRDLPNISNRKGGMQAKAGKLTSDKKGKKGKSGTGGGGSTSTATAKKPTNTAPKSYSPYRGYDPRSMTAADSNQGVAPGANPSQQKVNTKVRGVLHWAHGK
jgi:hypothetical protein